MPPASTSISSAHRSASAFTVIGGDRRMTHLAERLVEEGYTVSLLGCGNDCLPPHDQQNPLRICSVLQKAVEDAAVLILPLPATRDGTTIYCPRDPDCKVTFEDLAILLARHPNMILFGGKLPHDFCREINTQSIRAIDYYENPVLQLRNAYITAEAALMTAMELTDRTLRDTSVGVLGYGRIGKYLSRLLHTLGADVTVCARREESLFEAAAEGCHPLLITDNTRMNGLHPLCRDHAILFNTIPSEIMTRELLTSLERDTLLIDLASAPFGACDSDVREATAHNGLRYLRAPSLPGSYAPRDAGRILAECILDTLANLAISPEISAEGGKES